MKALYNIILFFLLSSTFVCAQCGVNDIIVSSSSCSDVIQAVADAPFPAGTYFEWSDGQAGYIEDTADSMVASQSGTYTVTVTYTSGCVQVFSKNVTVDPDGASVMVTTTPSCVGSNTGSIDLAALFPSGSINYNWADNTFDGMSTVTGLAAGEYFVRVQFLQGGSVCQNNSMTIRVEETPTSIFGRPNKKNDCGGDGIDDGEIDLIVTGGTGPYDLDWNVDALDLFGDVGGVVNYTGLALGIYSLTVTDANGCTQMLTDEVKRATTPEITAINGGPILCEGGVISLTVAGLNLEGNPDTEVKWTLPDASMVTEIVGNGGRTLGGMTQLGTYTVLVTRPNGCSDESSIFISQNDPIIVEEAGRTTACDGSATATQTISVVGGTGPYEYDWDIDGVGDFDDMATSPPFAPTGTITVVVRDAIGCTEALVFSRGDFNAPNIDIEQTAISCLAGTVELTILDNDSNPGSWSGGSDIAWSHGVMGSIATGADIIDVSAIGTYTVTVTKNNGCSSMASIEVTSVPDLMAEVTSVTESCQDVNSGEIDVTITGGVPPYDFDWNNDGSGDFNDPEDLTGLAPNTYMLTVRDADGCMTTTMATVAEEAATITITTVLNGACQGDSIAFSAVIEYTNPPATGTIEVTADGQTKNIDIGVNNPFYVGFNILADGTGATINAKFTDANCSATANYTQPIDCSVMAPACTTDAIGGILYLDYNNDGIQDPTEHGEYGFPITVYDLNYNILCSTTTDHFGRFTCTGLTAGQDVIVFVAGNSVTSFAVAGPDNDLNFYETTVTDCDISIGTVIAPSVGLAEDFDFNYEIGNRVWADSNNSSFQNAGEQSLAGVNVELYDALGVSLGQTMTDASGEYYFNNSNVPTGLDPNTTYYIVFGRMGQFDTGTNILDIGDGNEYELVAQNITSVASGNDAILASGLGLGFDGLPYIEVNLATANNHNLDAGFINVCPMISDIIVTEFTCGSFLEIVATNLLDSTFVQWSNGQSGYVINNGGHTIFASESGMYSVTITSPGGCEATYSENLTVSNGFGITVSTTPACSGNNGAIQLNVTGSGIVYNWENNAFDGMSTVTGLATGIYKVLIQVPSGDNDGQFCNNTIDILVPDTPLITDIIIDPRICGDKIEVVTNGPFPEGTYFEWSNGQAGYSAASADDIYINQSGSYTVTITYPNGCVGTFTKEVTVRAEGPGTTVDITPSCAGLSTGIIDITAELTDGTVTYDWLDNAYDGMSTVTGLAPGEYFVAVRFAAADGSNCGTNSMTLRVEEAPPFSLTNTVVGSMACTSGVGSSIDIETVDGIGPFTYDWDNDGTGDFDDSQDLMNIPPGTYTLVVQDAAACEQIIVVEVPFIGTPLAIQIESTSNAKCGATDGAIDITIANGSGNYEYDWNNDGTGDFDDLQDLTGLGAGNYLLVARDIDTGCENTVMISISEEGSNITLDLTATSFCDANRPGSIDMTINSTAAFPLFSIEWDNDGVGDNNDTEDLSNLMPGSYSVTVTDVATACMATGSVTIDGNDLAADRIIIPSCDNSPNAAIDVTITGGVMPYMIDWNNDGTGDFDDPEDLIGLDPTLLRTYQGIIEDAAGCRDTVFSNSVGLIGVSITTEQLIECETSETKLIIDGTFSNGITIEWSTGLSGTVDSGADTITVAVPSTYTVTVTKRNGCTDVGTFIVEPLTDIMLDFTKIDVCDANISGSIDMTISGGLAPYMIDWNNDGTGDNDDMEDLTNLATGIYTVIVTDANGCTGAGMVTIANGPVITDIITAAGSCGSPRVRVEFSNVQDGAFIQWSNGTAGIYPDPSADNPNYAIDQFINMSGMYSVTITNPDGCSTVYTETITIPTSTGFALDVVITPDCGDGNGGVELIASGGTGTYTYDWFDNTYDGQSTVTDLTAGDYYVVVDDGGCFTATLIRIPTGDGFDLNAVVDDECVGDNPFNGNIDMTIMGGTGPFTIDWDNDGIGDNDDTEDLMNLSAGTYSVTVTSAEGCTQTATTNIGTQSPEPLIIGDSQICPGEEQVIYLQGVNPTYDIEWSTGLTGMLGTGDTIRVTQPGLYSVTVTDPQGCFKTTSIAVRPYYQLFINPINQGCNGELGRIDLSIVGDTGPYTIDWDNDGIGDNDDSVDLINLASGTYNVTVTDSNGCEQTASATVDPFDEIIIGTLGIDPLCNGVPGTASVFVGGDGRPPFTFIWSANAGVTPGSNTSIATGLDAGTYSVTVIDAVGCRESATFELDEPIIDIIVTATITDALCIANSNDGAIDVTVSGGVEPYTFNWSNGATTGDINSIGVGNYTLTITDANGCLKEMTFDVPGFLDLSVQSVTNVCSDSDLSGAVDVTVTGGSGSFIYDWDNDGLGDNDDSEDVTGLGAGTYTLYVYDQNLLCTGIATVDILNVKPEVTLVGDTTICEGQTTTLQAIGNIYNGETIAWSTGQMGTVATNSDTINVDAIGIYTVVTTSADPAACTDMAVIRVVPALEIFVTPQNIGCNGELGTVDLQITGDSGPYQIDWDIDGTGDFDDAEDLINLNIGVYNVSVANENGCIVTASTQIEPFDLIANGIVAQDPVCNGLGGVIAIFPGGDGRPPFSFAWSDNVVLNPGDNPQILTNLDPGTYIVTVTDANGCEQVESISLGEPTITVDISASITSSSCSSGNNNGEIDITPTGGGGSGIYTYQWSNNTTTQDLNGIGTGEYIVTVTDLDGCMAVDTFNVEGTFILEIDNVVDACLNEGSIDISPIGISPGQLVYDWSNDGTGDFDDTRNITGLSPGTYNLNVRDMSGCTGSISATVEQATIEVEITGNPMVCTGNPTNLEVIDLNNSLANDTQIAWSTGASGIVSDGLNIISIDMPETYSATVTTAAGCSDVATFIAVPPYEVFITPTNLGCNGELGLIDLNISGDTGPYAIDWDIDGVGDNDDTEDLSNLSPGLYTVTITDNNACSVMRTIEIEPFEEIIIGTVEIDPLCEGVNGTVGVFVGGDGRAPFTYIWSPNAGVEFGDNIAFINDLESGLYTVTVIDNNGCREEKEFILEDPIIEVTLATNITPSTCIAGIEDGAIDLTVMSGAAPYLYEWSNGAITEDLTTIPLGSYDLTVTDLNGCFAITEITVPGELDLSIQSTQDVCSNNATNGAIDINIMGGSGMFEYDWDNDGTGDFDDAQNLTGISTGNYRLVVRDTDSQCSGTIDADIVNLDPNINLIGDTTICGSQITTLQVLGNIVNGEILEWNTGQIGTVDTDSDTINVSAIGIYSVTATTVGNTICADTATIRVVPALEVFISPSNLGCNGEPGSIDLQINGDSGPYLVDWDTDGTGDFDDPEDLTGLTEGMYTVSVVNADGCVESNSAEITPFDLFVNGVVKQDPVCDGIYGVIGIFPGGDGRPPFILDWSPNVSVPAGDPGQIITGLEPGSYSVTVTDFNGCMQADTIELANYTRIVNTSATMSSLTCTNNEMDGAIDLSVSDGGGTYTYNWSTGAMTEDINMLSAGVYSVTVLDQDGCIARDTFDIEPALQIENLAILGDTFICNDGSTKELSVTGDFLDTDMITWSTGTMGTQIMSANTTTITSSGMYSVTITNATGCSGSTTITVTDESINSLTISGDNFVCAGTSKDVFVTGDFDENDIIEWSSGTLGTSASGADSIRVSSAGMYMVTITNEFVCNATTSISISDESISSISIEGDNFLCDDTTNKELTVTGDFDASATIAWSTGVMGTITDGANQISINTPDVYSVTITNSFGCSATTEITVTDESFGTLSIQGISTACEDDLTQTLTVVGDIAPTDNITWSTGLTGTIADGANQLMVTMPGLYSVLITNSVGCSVSTSITVTDESISSIGIDGDNFLCGNEMKTLTVTGDIDATTTIAWSTGVMGTITDGANQITISSAGTYSATVTNSTGCTATSSIVITDEQIVNLEIQGVNSTCDNMTSQDLILVGDIDADATIAWSTGLTGTITDGANQITISSSGTYSATVTNSFACSARASITVTNNGLMAIAIEGDDFLCADEMKTLMVTGDIDANTMITWSTGIMGTIADGANQIAVDMPGTYSVTVTNGSACTATSSIVVRDEQIVNLEIQGDNFLCADEMKTLMVTGDIDANTMITWSTGIMGTIADGANQITITSADTYSVTVTNSFGCSESTLITLRDEQINSITIEGMTSICSGMNPQDLTVTGDIDATAIIEWSTGVMGTIADGANQVSITLPGTYSVTVTNRFGCTKTTSVDIENGQIGLSIVPTQTTLCDGEILTLIAQGDFDSSTNIEWSTGAGGNPQVDGGRIVVSTPGIYSVTATNSTGCTGTASIEIIDADITNLDIDGEDMMCTTGAKQNLTVTGDFDASATIEWSTNIMGTIADGANQITITTPGTYSVTVTNKEGCSATSSIVVRGNPGPSITRNITNVGCQGSNGSIELNVIGTAPFIFDWNHLPGVDNPMNITNVPPGTYTVMITDALGCSSTEEITLTDAKGDAKCLPATFTIKQKPTSNTGTGTRKRK